MGFYTDAQVKLFMDHVKKVKGTKYTPDQYDEFEQHVKETRGMQAPGATEANAMPSDKLLPSDKIRMAAGFSDPASLKAGLERMGYRNGHLDESGNVTAQDKEGNWVKDQNNFWPSMSGMSQAYQDYKKASANRPGEPVENALGGIGKALQSAHPLNYLESSLGQLPKNIGWLGGGLAGGELAGPAGAIPLAGVGAGAGEMARQKIGQMIGSNRADLFSPESQAAQISAAKSGALNETLGRVIGKVPLPASVGGNVEGALAKGGDWLLDQARKPVAAVSSAMSRVPYEDVMNLMRKPYATLFKSSKGATAEIAPQLASEIEANEARLGSEVGAANVGFKAAHGETPFDTSGVIAKNQEMLGEKPFNDFGQGRLSSSDESELGKLEHSFQTHVEATPMDTVVTEGGPKLVPAGEAKIVESLPQQTGANLKGTVDYIDTQKAAFKKNSAPGTPWDPYTQQLQVLRGKIKGLMHGAGSPEAERLAAADQAYTGFQRNMDIIPGSVRDNPQPFVKGLFRPENEIPHEAVAEVAPKIWESRLQPLKSATAYKRAANDSAWRFAKTAGGTGALTAMGVGAALHNPMTVEGAAATLGVLGAMSPTAHKYGLGLSSMPINGAWSLLKSRGIAPTISNAYDLGEKASKVVAPQVNRTPQSDAKDAGAGGPGAGESSGGGEIIEAGHQFLRNPWRKAADKLEQFKQTPEAREYQMMNRAKPSRGFRRPLKAIENNYTKPRDALQQAEEDAFQQYQNKMRK